MVPPDERFTREGRSLGDWLPDLLSSDPGTRRRAENAVSAMWWGALVADASVYVHGPSDRDAHRREFEAMIGRILNDPDFAGIQFVTLAIEVMKDDVRRCKELSELKIRLFDADEPEASDVEREITEQIEAVENLEKEGRLPNSLGTYTLHIVMECAGPVLLQLPDLVRAALRDRDCCRPIVKALERLGPAAAEFVPDLLSPDQPGAEMYGIPCPEALASIAREGQTVQALLDYIRSDDDRMAYSASATLAKMGPKALQLVPSLIDQMVAIADASDRGAEMLCHVSGLAPERRDVFERILARARPSPPEIRYSDGDLRYPYDAARWRRGSAISALGHFKSFASEAVPVLVDALDSFEEYDPDWGYENGDHGRVIDALSRLGAPAAAAIPAVVRHLRDSEGAIDWRIIRFLADFGRLACEALPTLQQLKAETSQDTDEHVSPDDPACEYLDPLTWAIARIGR